MTERQPLLQNNNNNNNNNNEVHTITNLLTKTHIEISQFEKSLKDYGTVRDTDSFRHNLHLRKLDISENLKRVSDGLRNPSIKGKIPKIQLDKLVKGLTDDTNAFNQLVHQSMQAERQHQPIKDQQFRNSLIESPSINNLPPNIRNTPTKNNYNNNNYSQQQRNNNYYDDDDNQQRYQSDYNNNNNYSQQQQIQQQYQTFGLGGQSIDQDEVYEEIIKERNKATKQLVDDMLVLKEVMNDISDMVVEQGEQLVVANDNVEVSDQKVEEAVIDLEKAHVYKSSYRKKLVCLLVCLFITLVGVVIFLGVWFGVLKK